MARKLRKRKQNEKPQQVEIHKKNENKYSEGFNFSGIFRLALLTVVFTTLIRVSYLFYHSPISPVEINDLGERLLLEGIYTPNDVIQKGKKLLEGYFGHECMAFDEDQNLYTGLEDGRIIKVYKDKDGGAGEGRVEEIWSPKANMAHNERPLGLRYHSGKVYVADGYLGVYVLDLISGERTILARAEDLNPKSKLIDDLTISSNGKTIYFTSASTSYGYTEVLYDSLEGRCTGAVYKLNLKDNTVELFQDSLCFANGIQLSAGDDTLLVSETSRYRVRVYDVNTKELIKTIRFPSMPDNIRLSNDGGYLIALVLPRTNRLNVLHSSPFLRRLFAGVCTMEQLYSAMIQGTEPTGFVKLNSNFEAEEFICDSTSTMATLITTAVEDKEGNYYVGSYLGRHITKVNKKDLS